MTLQQLHYTSAAPGPDGSGFRFTAVSEDVPATLLGEVEQLVGYEPPRDAPARPTADELAAMPVAFGHHRLSDGSRLLCRVVYVGTDYSGRYGNFHAHAVRLPEGRTLPGGMLPIEAWGSPFWARDTPEGGSPDQRKALTPEGRPGKARLVEFARSRARRLEPFLADVRALFRAADAPQLLLVERDSADAANWIAIASSALPTGLADRLTFTTYTRRPLLARQQIVGTFPDADADFGEIVSSRRYRVHGGTDAPTGPAPAASDTWAAVAARLWLAGRPELVAHAARRQPDAGIGVPDDAGYLAALAVREGVGLDAAGRTAAARWAAARSSAAGVSEDSAAGLLPGLAAGGTERTAEEWTALADLADAFAALAGHPAVEPLAHDLRAELDRASTTSGTPLDVLLALHRLAGALRLDRTAVVPVIAERTTAGLLDASSGTGDATRAALGHPELAAAVLGLLDRAAATGDPSAVARALPAALRGAALALHPHLRMAAALADGGHRPPADRPGLFDFLMSKAGDEGRNTPSVPRTAFRLAWGDTPPTTAEAGILLDRIPEAWLSGAGLDTILVRTALDSLPDDRHAPRLAKELLARRGATLDPRQRAALSLLDLAGDLATGEAEPRCAGRAVALRAQARPLEPGIDDRVSTALAERLLDADTPPAELLVLAQCDDGHFLRAYARAARRESVADRMRRVPPYAAHCFVAWQTASGSGGRWEEIRTDLLTSVLRPVVRRMPAEDVDALRERLRQRGGPWAARFEEWERPGVLGRFGSRWRGRGGKRPGGANGHGAGDIQPPRDERVEPPRVESPSPREESPRIAPPRIEHPREERPR
ncbi:GTPase-associated protein 1-related protein [Streptomyces sp. URMC 126]|uniref:GTPase-associated protein 1-related protein n=1 Tax=Streptomyces sp. URMC 126 TaxID=3423401 RepID=UPI003F1BE64F